ncbi:MAG: hypothetical protein D6706_04350 [Chloroflexi bacterium]|nr:MAG: hypothetical protein D6706_04350 [Chloroflexota bacterium]
MPAKFSWRTEEDADWDNEIITTPEPPQEPKPYAWKRILLIVVLLAGVGLVIYRQVGRQIEAATQNAEADVRSSLNLMYMAIETADPELFNSILSGRDPAWTVAEQAVFQANLVVDRSPLGLQIVPFKGLLPGTAVPPEAIQAVSLSPDLNTAEITVVHPYIFRDGPGITDTISLAQTFIYRRGNSRWLFSPPQPDFWGNFATFGGEYITVTYPLRDETLALRLANDLDKKLTELCQRFSLNCPDDFRVRLRLETDPATLAMLAEPEALHKGSLRLELPTPTLVGIPLDETGYELLYRGYATAVVSAAISTLLKWECCDHARFYQAFLDYHLSELGLKVWPVTHADYQRLLNVGFQLPELTAFWHDSELTVVLQEKDWQIYTFVDFLIHRFPEVSPIKMMSEIRPQLSFFTWLADTIDPTRELGTGSDFMDNLDIELAQFAYAQSRQGAELPPVPLPEQDLLMVCSMRQETGRFSYLYQYDWRAEAWTQVYSLPSLLLLYPGPKDEGAIVQMIDFNEDVWQPFLWQGELLPIGGADETPLFTFGQTTPDGRFLVSYAPDTERQNFVPRLIDWTSCLQDNCQPASLPGQPIWSPDGQQVLYEDTLVFDSNLLELDKRFFLFGLTLQANHIWRAATGNEDALQEVGAGYAPVWVDNTHYAYIRFEPAANVTVGEEINVIPSGPAQQLVMASVVDDEPHVLVTLDELKASIPADVPQPAFLVMRYGVTHSAHPNQIFLVALSLSASHLYVFRVDVETEEVAFLFRAAFEPNHSMAFGPNGRFLVLTSSTRGLDNSEIEVPGQALMLYDTQTDKRHTFLLDTTFSTPSVLYDWSADGEWLVYRIDERVLGLMAPTHDFYQQLIRIDLGGVCGSLVWVSR